MDTVESRLLDDRGLPSFGLDFYIVKKVGDHAGVSLYEGARFAVCGHDRPRVESVCSSGRIHGARPNATHSPRMVGRRAYTNPSLLHREP